MEHLYHNLSPDEVNKTSDLFIGLSLNVEQNPYLHELVRKIELEQQALQHSIAYAHQCELTQLIVSADREFIAAFNSFHKMVQLKSQIDTNIREQKSSALLLDIVDFDITHLDRVSPMDMINRVKICLNELRHSEDGDGLEKAGVNDLFTVLICAFRTLEILQMEREKSIMEVHSPAIASRQLARTLQDLHSHIKSYSRLGDDQYHEPLTQIEDHFRAIPAI